MSEPRENCEICDGLGFKPDTDFEACPCTEMPELKNYFRIKYTYGADSYVGYELFETQKHAVVFLKTTGFPQLGYVGQTYLYEPCDLNAKLPWWGTDDKKMEVIEYPTEEGTQELWEYVPPKQEEEPVKTLKDLRAEAAKEKYDIILERLDSLEEKIDMLLGNAPVSESTELENEDSRDNDTATPATESDDDEMTPERIDELQATMGWTDEEVEEMKANL